MGFILEIIIEIFIVFIFILVLIIINIKKWELHFFSFFDILTNKEKMKHKLVEWVSDCCLTPIVQLFHGENKLIAMMEWDDDEVHFVQDQHA